MTRWVLVCMLLPMVWGCRAGDQQDVSRQRESPADAPEGNAPRTSSPDATASSRSPGASLDSGAHFAGVTNLQQFDKRTGKPETARLAGIIDILRGELQTPGLPSMGLGGGPIDSGYVLAQATHLLGLQIAPQLISDAQGHETDPAMRELLAVALAIARDPSQAPEVRRIAKEHRMGSIRALAIKGLRRLADTDSLQTLLHALRDRYTAIAGLEGVGTAPLRKVYPVRREAVLALRAFGNTVPADSVVDVPLSAPPSDAALYAHLLEDQDPQSCLAAVQLLATQGAAGRPYLQTFIAKNRNEPTLQQSVNLAQRSLAQ